MSLLAATAGGATLSAVFRTAATTALAIAALCFAAFAASGTMLTLCRCPGDVEVIELSLKDLGEFPPITIKTENEFVDGIVSYRGPLVRDVIEHLALGEAAVLRFTAVNDYSVEIPTSDFVKYDVILAMEADGEPLSRRERGPLWLMYPITENAELNDPKYNPRLIWQVVRIESI